MCMCTRAHSHRQEDRTRNEDLWARYEENKIPFGKGYQAGLLEEGPFKLRPEDRKDQPCRLGRKVSLEGEPHMQRFPEWNRAPLHRACSVCAHTHTQCTCTPTPDYKKFHLTSIPPEPNSYRIRPVALNFQRPIHHLALNLPRGLRVIWGPLVSCCHLLCPQVCHVEPGV